MGYTSSKQLRATQTFLDWIWATYEKITTKSFWPHQDRSL